MYRISQEMLDRPVFCQQTKKSWIILVGCFKWTCFYRSQRKPTDMQPNYSGKVRGWTYCGKTQRLQKSNPTSELLSPCQSATCQITKFTGCQNDRLHCWHSREYLYVHVLKNLCKKQPAEWDACSRHVVSCSPTSGSSMGSLPHGVHPQKRKLNR